jgi:regulator of replication initiation timing
MGKRVKKEFIIEKLNELYPDGKFPSVRAIQRELGCGSTSTISLAICGPFASAQGTKSAKGAQGAPDVPESIAKETLSFLKKLYDSALSAARAEVEQQRRELEGEIEKAQNDLLDVAQESEEREQTIEDQQAQIDNLNQKVGELSTSLASAKAQLVEARAAATEAASEKNKLQIERDTLSKQLQQAQADLKAERDRNDQDLVKLAMEAAKAKPE